MSGLPLRPASAVRAAEASRIINDLSDAPTRYRRHERRAKGALQGSDRAAPARAANKLGTFANRALARANCTASLVDPARFPLAVGPAAGSGGKGSDGSAFIYKASRSCVGFALLLRIRGAVWQGTVGEGDGGRKERGTTSFTCPSGPSKSTASGACGQTRLRASYWKVRLVARCGLHDDTVAAAVDDARCQTRITCLHRAQY